MKRFIISGLVVLAAASAIAQQQPATAPASPVVATVNGDKITLDDVQRVYSKLPPKMHDSYEQNGGISQFIDTYINKRLLVQEALKEKFEQRPDVAAALEDARDSAIFDLYVKRVVADSVISEAEMRQYYSDHQKDFTAPERIHAFHIIATPLNQPVMNTTGDNAKTDNEAQMKITELLAKAKPTPETFSMIARRFSEDASAGAGGDLGWFTRGKMVPAFEDAAFALKKGEISGVVKTQFGYHLIYVADREDAHVKPYEEVRADIRDKFLAERADKVLMEVNLLTRELRESSSIQVNKDAIR